MNTDSHQVAAQVLADIARDKKVAEIHRISAACALLKEPTLRVDLAAASAPHP